MIGNLKCIFAAPMMSAVLLLAAGHLVGQDAADSESGRLAIAITDEGGNALPCRIHLRDADGNPIVADDLPRWRGHFVCSGSVDMECPAGMITYEVERGPEYAPITGETTVEPNQTARLEVKLQRIADLASDGWYSGDLHIHRPVEHARLLMQAEDLHIGPVITWWNRNSLWQQRQIPDELTERFDGDRWLNVMAGEDEREGGALMYYHLPSPLEIRQAQREYPSPMEFVLEARDEVPSVWIDIEKPFWWDMPVWVASGKVDSIGIANNHMCRETMLANEAWGRPRDSDRLPSPLGNGYWTQEIYYHLLNTGVRLPPSAGSASGVLPNPVGYNRVYVKLAGEPTYEKWWDGLKRGRSFVTNGPLLEVTANDQWAGYVFRKDAGARATIEIKASLISKDDLDCVELIRDGQIVEQIEIDGRRASCDMRLEFVQSGWFLVRAFADNDQTFRFASTAPFYVEIGEAGASRISRRSAQFFVDWVEERIQRVKSNLANQQQRDSVLKHQHAALLFWRERLANANAD